MVEQVKNLFIVRGVAGSGKSTLAHAICANVACNDDYFMDADGNYNYDKDKMYDAILHCRATVKGFMEAGEDVAVANMFIKNRTMKAYNKLAEEYGYRVFVMTVENRHGGTNSHNVSEEDVENMKLKFEVKL